MTPHRRNELTRIHGHAGRAEIAVRRDRLGARIAATSNARLRARLIEEDRFLADRETALSARDAA